MTWNWNNIVTTPNRWAAYWLRRRGWICFYLDEQARHCGPECCWMQLYLDGERRAREDR